MAGAPDIEVHFALFEKNAIDGLSISINTIKSSMYNAI